MKHNFGWTVYEKRKWNIESEYHINLLLTMKCNETESIVVVLNTIENSQSTVLDPDFKTHFIFLFICENQKQGAQLLEDFIFYYFDSLGIKYQSDCE